MNVINSIFTSIAHILFWPLAQWPLLDLVCWSAVAGLLFTIVFRYLSPQSKLALIRDRISGNLLAINVFRDDPVTTLRCIVRIVGCVTLRLLYWLPAMLVFALPFMAIVGQFAARYEHRPLALGESTVVEVELTPEAWRRYHNTSIGTGSSLAIDTPAVHDDERNTMAWRVRAITAGKTDIRLELGDSELVHEVAVAIDTSRLTRTTSRRPGPGFLDGLLHPAEQAVSAKSPFKSININYPRRTTPVWSWNVPWWLTSMLVYLLTAMFAGWRFGVEF